MLFDALDEDCAEGTSRTHIFACSAAQTTLGVDHGNAWRILAAILLSYHLYCSVGAVTLAVVAGDAIFVSDAVVGYPHSCSYLCSALLLGHDGLYCSVGADVGTSGAGCAAESALERHFGLHEAIDAARGAQHIVGTF